MADIVRNDERNRYELRREGHLAELVFERDEDAIIIIHTAVPHEMEGTGVGGELVRAVLADAKEHHLGVVPACPFARGWPRRHPEAAEGVDIRWLPDRPDE